MYNYKNQSIYIMVTARVNESKNEGPKSKIIVAFFSESDAIDKTM